jgi:hypothetical protein
VQEGKQLLKPRPYKTAIHALQPRDTTSRVHFCSWFLQSVVESEIDPKLKGTAFSTPPVICNNFIPNVIRQQVYCFIGKIRMRLAAGGAPVAVNRSTKVRTALYRIL